MDHFVIVCIMIRFPAGFKPPLHSFNGH